MEVKQHILNKQVASRDIKVYFELNVNENTTHQSLRKAAKAVIRVQIMT